MTFLNNAQIDVKPTKIISGLEPEKTNNLFLAIYAGAVSGKDFEKVSKQMQGKDKVKNDDVKKINQNFDRPKEVDKQKEIERQVEIDRQKQERQKDLERQKEIERQKEMEKMERQQQHQRESDNRQKHDRQNNQMNNM